MIDLNFWSHNSNQKSKRVPLQLANKKNKKKDKKKRKSKNNRQRMTTCRSLFSKS